MLLLLACSAPDTSSPEDTEPVATVETAETGETALDTSLALNGTWPDEPVPLPQFTAHNRDNNERGPEHLTGHITVMWFYPAADTPG